MSLLDEKVEVSKALIIECDRAFRALAKDKNSYLHKVFSDDYVFHALRELEDVCKKAFPDK